VIYFYFERLSLGSKLDVDFNRKVHKEFAGSQRIRQGHRANNM